MSDCFGAGGGDGIITFDRLASRWVIARRAFPSNNNYFYCVAVSNTDDLKSSTLSWHTYEFSLDPILGTNSRGDVYWPDWPRFGSWRDAYYVSFDLQDVDNQYLNIGVVACALDRNNMLNGATARPMQCFSNPSPIPLNGTLYLAHSLIPADVDSTTAPPAGRHEYFLSIQNPPADGKTLTSTKLNLWNFHVNWSTPTLSTFVKSQLTVTSYEPGCYDLLQTSNTFCVNEPSSKTTSNYVDSVGDRLMPPGLPQFRHLRIIPDQPDGAGGNRDESANGNSLVRTSRHRQPDAVSKRHGQQRHHALSLYAQHRPGQSRQCGGGIQRVEQQRSSWHPRRILEPAQQNRAH